MINRILDNLIKPENGAFSLFSPLTIHLRCLLHQGQFLQRLQILPCDCRTQKVRGSRFRTRFVSKARTRPRKVPQNTEVRVVPRRRFVPKRYKTPPQVIYKTTKKKRVVKKRGSNLKPPASKPSPPPPPRPHGKNKTSNPNC